MRRRVIVGVAVLLLLGLIGLVGVPFLMRQTPGPTAENFRTLYLGLPEQKALELLGPPQSSVNRPESRAVDLTWHVSPGWQIDITTVDGKIVAGQLVGPVVRDCIQLEVIDEDPGLLKRVWRSVRL